MQAVLDRDLLSVRIDTERLSDPVDPALLFDVPVSEVWFEIGFGAGEHLAAQAENHADIGVIGAEIFENGIASLLRHRDERGLTNIRILTQDAREFLPRLSDGSLKRVYLL